MKIVESVKILQKLKESGGLNRDQIEEIEKVIRNLDSYNQEICDVASKTCY